MLQTSQGELIAFPRPPSWTQRGQKKEKEIRKELEKGREGRRRKENRKTAHGTEQREGKKKETGSFSYQIKDPWLMSFI